MLQISMGKLQCVMQCTCVVVLMCVCLNAKCLIIVKNVSRQSKFEQIHGKKNYNKIK